MEENNKPVHVRKVIKISRGKTVAWVIVLAIVIFIGQWAVRGFLGNSTGIGAGAMPPPMMSGEFNFNTSSPGGRTSATDAMGGMMNYFYPSQQTPSYQDSREFLKTSYSAGIRTRHVQDMIKEVKNIVKGADGRVDSISSNPKFGYLNFVVPKSEYDAFKDDVEGLTHRKLINVSESSVNLLTQKQGIEQQALNIQTSLDSLQKSKADLTANHNKTIAAINKQMQDAQTQISTKQSQAAATTDAQVKSNLQAEISMTEEQWAKLQEQKNIENSMYASKSKSYDSQIAGAKNNQNANIEQDTQFTDNIETVNGTVNASWISIWSLAVIFSPVHPTIIVIILALILLFWLNRRGYIPKIVFA